MASFAGAMDLLRLVPKGGPAICNVSVTNLCNATCDFCNFAHDKGFVTDRRSLDASRFAEGLARLKREAGVRFVTFMGGEPLLHKNIVEMVRTATEMGVQPTMVTNGWLLPPKVDALADAGITTLFISIDAPTAEVHEKNRGLRGVCERIREANAKLTARGVTVIASVAMTRLVTDYAALARFVKSLGFSAITFSYPRKAALGSSSLVWSEDSELVDMTPAEILAAFDAAEGAREIIPVHNPRAGLADMRRRLTGQGERFICHAGYKYFYLDWNYDLWRCEDWDKPLASLWDFTAKDMVRDGCQACTTDCYRDASIMLHFAIAIGDAFASVREGRPLAAFKALTDRRNAGSIGAVIGHGARLTRLAGAG
ncbi:radical SAM protein [Siccirubricoccus sp. KC 17139]|uniref:Radical SAM protein n=1 Tax=Siccirubricoccus soli TaxID=2899147 RepID=A0ABT1D431_9PROT|nr:radical SAM protein [Siccirubricoccus soli]MCO6415740.1 radical SAM protein [Siccirubricoccus soli]MCP2681872.1 radical SAM protein [Siccirubricoccus soli]